MKTISKLHYITQDIIGLSHVDLIRKACEEGIDWVQLRLKYKPYEECLHIAHKAREICTQYETTLIVNDNVMIAKEVGADGVHLGKGDMHPIKARAILGDQYIIGGTANTFEDIKLLSMAGVNYLGLGPFRFTSTKENLSPILGIEGYQSIVKKCREHNIQLPIIAIGGVVKTDVAALLETGVYGIAVASAIGLSDNFKSAINDFKEILRYKRTAPTIL